MALRRVEGRLHHPAEPGSADPYSPVLTTLIGGLLAAAAPAFIFFAGWEFLRSYLAPFGIQVTELGLDAWQISALSLSGVPLNGGASSAVLPLDWLLVLSVAIVLWLAPISRRFRTWQRAGVFVLVAVGCVLGARALDSLVQSGADAAMHVLNEEGPYFVPLITATRAEAKSDSDAGGATEMQAIAALDSCVGAQALLKAIFVVNGKEWLFCRPDARFTMRYVFVVSDEDKLVSFRRVDVSGAS